MNHDYDIFEQMQDGTPIWRCHAIGLRECHEKLRELAVSTNNECFAIHLSTKEIVGRLNRASSAAAR